MTGQPAYTDADVQAAMDAIDNATLSDGLGVFETGTVTHVARALLDAVAPAIAARARQDALREAITAHRELHRIYGSTATCGGGIGGQAVTQHCGITCNRGNHDAENAAWEAIEKSYFDGEAEQ